MYDPLVGRFLSADNYVQDPSSSQSYNRYSYGLNNPLKFTDPSGMLLVPNNPAVNAYFLSLQTAEFNNSSGGVNGDDTNGDWYKKSYSDFWDGVFDQGENILNGPTTDDSNPIVSRGKNKNGQVGLWVQTIEFNGKYDGWRDGVNAPESNINVKNKFKADDTRGNIISIANATAAYGFGGTFDMGLVYDYTGDSKMYLTFGVTAGIGATAGLGYSRTNSGFRTNQLAGGATNTDLTINFGFLKVFSLSAFGDWIYGKSQFPGSNSRGGGINIGIGTGYFQSWTFTLLAPPIPNDFWDRPGRHY